MDNRKFAARLNKYSVERKMKIADLADAADLSESHLRLLMTGKPTPSYETLMKLAKALRVTPNCFICDEDIRSIDFRDISCYKVDSLNENQIYLLKNFLQAAIKVVKHEIPDNVGARISELREAKHMTSTKLSNLIEIKGGYIRNIERGSVLPSIDTLEKIAIALEVDLNYLICDDFKEAELYVLNDMMKNAQTQLSLEDYNFLKFLFNSIIGGFAANDENR